MPRGRLNIVNRDEYHTFVPTPIEEHRVTKRVKSFRLERTSPDEQYEKLKKKGLNIDISNPEIMVNGKKPNDGIFSPLFGADTTQDAPVFTCDCHKLTGGTNLGKVCPHCGSVVRTIEADLRITGHIDIAPYHILTFHGYNAMSRVFKNLKEIVETTRRINRAGKIVDNGVPTIMDLYDDYDDLYAQKVGLPKDVVFMSKIPVYSSRLRPLMQTNMNMTILDVNKEYLSIVRMQNVLKATQLMPNFRREIEIQRALNQIQQNFNKINKIVVEQSNGKNGVFRRALASGRMDNSSRLVITLGPDLMAHEVDVPYQMMMVQYEDEIANYLSKIMDIPISTAISMIEENQTERNEMFVKIINLLLKSRKGIWMLDNRNPTISESGIQYVKIRKIHDDPTDVTLHLPQDVLALLAADFDGDQCTAIAVRNPKYHPYFITMCPTYAFIDRANGRFNRSMGFMKDFAALVSTAWDIDTAYDNYLLSPDEDTYDTLSALGLSQQPSRTNEDLKQIMESLLSGKNHGRFVDRFTDDFTSLAVKP